MLTWVITRGHAGEGTLVEFGWRGRRIAFRPWDRDDAEQSGTLKYGEWLMDGRWLVFYREQDNTPGAYEHSKTVGMAFGQRVWELSWFWGNPTGRTPGEIIPGIGKEVRRQMDEFWASRAAKSQPAHDEWDEEDEEKLLDHCAHCGASTDAAHDRAEELRTA